MPRGDAADPILGEACPLEFRGRDQPVPEPESAIDQTGNRSHAGRGPQFIMPGSTKNRFFEVSEHELPV
jgi:hypothetical protein